MSPEFAYALLGGFIGGVLGVLGTLISSYYGPRKMEEWRERQMEQRLNGPGKKLLGRMLEDERFKDGRRLETLRRVSGTTPEECRRLLIEIEARGVSLRDKNGHTVEGWALIRRKPLDDQ